jgi:hypothetical protein
LARLAYTAVSKTKTRRSSVFAVSPHRYLLRRRSLSPATIWPALPQIPPSCLRSRQSTVPPLLWPESPPTSHPRPAACRRATLLRLQLLEDLELLAAPPPPSQLQPKNDLTRGGVTRAGPAAAKVRGGRRSSTAHRPPKGCQSPRTAASAQRILQDGNGGSHPFGPSTAPLLPGFFPAIDKLQGSSVGLDVINMSICNVQAVALEDAGTCWALQAFALADAGTCLART